MTATYITGRNLTLTINSQAYNDQASTVTLEVAPNQAVLEVLSGRAYKTIDRTATLNVEMYADWGATSSLCDALWDAAKASPDTALTFSFDSNGSTFTGSCFPAFPTAGGGAVDVQTTTVALIVEDGSVTRS